MSDQEELQLVVVEQIKPVELFTSQKHLTVFLDEIKTKIMSIPRDAGTAKGRKEIASTAYKVARAKTILDDLGKDEVAKLKDLPKKIDAGRKQTREFLDALAKEYRQPLTDFEDAEKARIAAEEFARELECLHSEALEMNNLIEREKEVSRKEAEFARIEAEQKAKAEAERKAKEAVEREERLKAEAAEAAKREAAEQIRKAEEARIAAETKAKEEAERAAKAAAEAERKRLEDIEKARLAQEAAVRDAERKAKEEAEHKERERIAAEEQERQREAKRIANAKHRAKIEREAILSFDAEGFDSETAHAVIKAISSGRIANVQIIY